MTVNCPYCNASLPPSASASLSVAKKCASCGKEFEFYAIERPYQALVPQLVEGRAVSSMAPPRAAPVMPPPGPPPAAIPPPIPPPSAPAPRTMAPQPVIAPGATTQPGIESIANPVGSPVEDFDTRPLAERTCANHANNQAAAFCQQCKRAICNLCATPTEGCTICPQCFEVLRARGALDSTQRAYNTPSLALGLAIATLLAGWIYCLGFLLGPLAIYFGVRALSEIDQRPELPGRRKAMAAIIIGAIGVAVSIGVLILLAAAGVVSEMGGVDGQ